MSPYIVRRGEVHDGGKVSGVGEFLPGSKGALADMEEAGAVEWVEPKREPKPEPKTKPASKSKAVK